MTPDTAQATKALEALFRTYPGFRADDLAATVKTYLHAVSIYETQDVIAGISDFITGNVPGHNPAFAPSAPQVGSAVRRAMERRLDAERRSRPALPPPEREDPTPEQKARVRALMEDFRHRFGSERSEAERQEQRRALYQRTNERFDRETLSYTTFNSADDDDHDMGQMGAA